MNDQSDVRSDDLSDWVTLSTFSWLQEAFLLRGRLESEGIQSQIPEEHLGSINPMLTGMQIRVQVQRRQLPEARALIKTFVNQNGVSSSSVCPHCGSHSIGTINHQKKNFLSALLGLLLMVPMRRQNARKVCNACQTPL